MDDILKRLLIGRDRIMRGWVQGTVRSVSGSEVCAAGALMEGEELNQHFAAYDYLCRAIDTAFIGTWNDCPERTQGEVIAAYDRAIKLREEDLLV